MTLREQLENPEIFQVNRIRAHSDHEAGLRQCLDGMWQFCYSQRMEDRPAGFQKEEYDLSAFGQIRVPGHMELQGFGTPQYINTLYPWDGVELLRPPVIPGDSTPVGSYVRFFDLEHEVPEGGEVFLSFGGVETAFSVWLNGTYVGYGEDSFTPSEFCVTELVRDRENRLAVEVYKRSSASWIEDQDFWRFSGIFRSVELITVPAKHLFDLKVQAGYVYDADTQSLEAAGAAEGGKVGDGILSVEMKLLSDQTPDPEDIHISILRPDGNEAVEEFLRSAPEEIEPLILTAADQGTSEEQVTASPRSRKLFLLRFSAVVPSVDPWSAEEPVLYQLKIGIGEQESILQNVGFRTFEMKGGIMCLNGKRIIFRGVNRHEFSPEGGRCISMEDMEKDVRIIKDNNMNSVRTCHYPNRTEWYHLCDRAGLYLIDETNLESHGSWQKLGRVEPSWNVPGDLPEWREAVLDRARSMYERDKNHPSVLIWSCGNESYAGEDIAAMSDYFHSVDPGRLVHYEGVFHNPKYRYISDMESRMYAKPAEVEAYLEDELTRQAEDPSYIMKPYISCEYMHAMGNSLGGMKLYTDLEDRYPGYQGGFIWDYIDQVLSKDGELLGGGDFDDRPTDYGFCTNGIVYGDRSISPKMQEVRALYSPIRIDVTPEEVTVENRNLFIDLSGYRFTARTMLDGVIREETGLEIAAKAGESVTVPHGLKLPEGPGEAVIEVMAYDRSREQENTDYGADSRVAFGQCVESHGVRSGAAGHEAGIHSQQEGFGKNGRIVTGDGYIGVIGEDFRIQFSMAEGGISSIRFKGREYIDRIPRLSFWRAMTDNDCGAGYPAKMGIWYPTGHFTAKDYSRFRVEPMEGGLRMITAFQGGLSGAVTAQVAYSVYPDGQILVEADYPGVDGYPQLPVFAMDFCTKPEVNRVTFLGMGPDENYVDRAEGARLGMYSYRAEENLSRYLRPQECGNRTGVRSFCVMDDRGVGLRFTAEDAPFEMSVLPYSAYELEEANRIWELPPVRHTWIRIASAEMGVGGDDSWGAPVHEEYLIDPARPQHLAFRISGIDPENEQK